jgi:putative addiction module component (TIGR02574 family)
MSDVDSSFSADNKAPDRRFAMTTTKSIVQAALSLPRKSRAALAEKLLASLEDEQYLLEAAQEAERRMQAYERGEIGGKPVEQTIARLRKKKRT